MGLPRQDRIEWARPDLEAAKLLEEINRASSMTGLKAEAIRDAIREGELCELDEDAWRAIENSSSLDVTKLKQAMEENKARGGGANVKDILGSWLDGHEVAPVLLRLGDSEAGPRYWLLNGETRLTLARIFAIVPRVLVADCRECEV